MKADYKGEPRPGGVGLTVDELVARVLTLEAALAPFAAHRITMDRITQNLVANGADPEKVGVAGGLWVRSSMGIHHQDGTTICGEALDAYGRERAGAEFDERVRQHSEAVVAQAEKKAALASGSKTQ